MPPYVAFPDFRVFDVEKLMPELSAKGTTKFLLKYIAVKDTLYFWIGIIAKITVVIFSKRTTEPAEVSRFYVCILLAFLDD